MSHSQFTERPLSDAEVQDRRMMLEHFLDEQDDLTGEIAEKKREIKESNVAIERVTARVRQLRHEIRNRMVLDAAPVPQQTLPHVEGLTPIPPVTGPAPAASPAASAAAAERPDPYAWFRKEYPPYRHGDDLYVAMDSLLTAEQKGHLPDECPWHPDTGIFHAVDNWARIELCHLDSEARAAAGHAPIAGATIPARVPMPDKLTELVGAPATKRKRKLTNRQQGK